MVARKRKVSEIWTEAAITPKRYEIGCELAHLLHLANLGYISAIIIIIIIIIITINH